MHCVGCADEGGALSLIEAIGLERCASYIGVSYANYLFSKSGLNSRILFTTHSILSAKLRKVLPSFFRSSSAVFSKDGPIAFRQKNLGSLDHQSLLVFPHKHPIRLIDCPAFLYDAFLLLLLLGIQLALFV